MNKVVPIEQARAIVATPAEMLAQAVSSGAGIEVVEKLLTLHERWEAMQARKAFDNAMAELRQNMPTIIKTQEASFGNGKAAYQYEDLSAVTEALSPIMAACGLSFRWKTASTDKGVSVTCVLSHKDGHSEETTLSAGLDTSGSKNPIQALGSAVTYLQRYTLKAAVGVAAAKDDDGHASTPVQAVQPLPNAKSRETFDRLVKATRACKSREEYDRLWTHEATLAAYASLPTKWKADMDKETREKEGELLDREAIRAASDPITQFDQMEQERSQ